MNALNTAIPDLLRRFAATPHSFRTTIRNTAVELHTNDADIVSEIGKLRGCDEDNRPAQPLLVKIIRDDAAPQDEEEEVTVVSSKSLITVLMGSGTMMCLDRDRREALGFVSARVPATYFVSTLFLLLLDRVGEEIRTSPQATSGRCR